MDRVAGEGESRAGLIGTKLQDCTVQCDTGSTHGTQALGGSLRSLCIDHYPIYHVTLSFGISMSLPLSSIVNEMPCRKAPVERLACGLCSLYIFSSFLLLTWSLSISCICNPRAQPSTDVTDAYWIKEERECPFFPNSSTQQRVPVWCLVCSSAQPDISSDCQRSWSVVWPMLCSLLYIHLLCDSWRVCLFKWADWERFELKGQRFFKTITAARPNTVATSHMRLFTFKWIKRK